MEKYIVVTLGPIFDTINLASSPAALWTGSYLFSYLNKTICRLLVEHGVPETDILTPYYTMDGEFPQDCDGVGLFHDRIIFRSSDFRMGDFPVIREETIAHLARTFAVDEAYLREYLLIRAAECEAENPILDTSAILDCLELAKPIVSGREDNPLLSMLVGDKNYGNENIKNLPLTQQLANWQLRKPNGQLKSISDIAGVAWNTGMKKHDYYAIVRADGDHMGDIIAKLNGDNIRNFSADCIFYCAEIAKKVREFGGVAIYSGGDDLLAIMPCENQRGETVFDFVSQANTLFTTSFSKEKYNTEVSLSIGVTICYHKFPLYEALEDSQDMLFGLAKSKRNCMAVHMQKHAGQSVGLVVPNDSLGEFIEQYRVLLAKNDNEWFHSVHHKLKLFRGMFLQADADLAQIKNLFRNIFDADIYGGNVLLHEKLPQFYYDIKTTLGIESVADIQDAEKANNRIEAAHPENEPIDTLCYILHLFKFFVEKGGKEE